MRALKKWLIIPLMVMGLVVSVFSATQASAATLLSSASNTYQAASLKDIQKIVNESMGNRETTVVIKYKGNTNKLLDVISGYVSQAIESDEYLNYSYRSVNMSYKAYGTNVTITLQFKYYESAKQINYVDQTIHTILERIISPGMDDHEKVKAVHDYVVLNLAYDTRLINNSPYPALTTGTTACNGYAMLIYKMLKQLGIEVRLISGVASSSSFDIQNHAWNMVMLDGKWYHLDATWDDPIPDESGRVLYNYYLLTDKEIAKDHDWKTGGINGEEKPYPVASTSYFNELQKKINLSNESDRYSKLLKNLELQYLLPELTAHNLADLTNLIKREFANYQKEFTIRYVDTSGDLKTNLRKIVYNSAVDKGVKSWSYGSINYIRGTSADDRLITVSDIVYNKVPPQHKDQTAMKYPTTGFNSQGSFVNVDRNKVWTIQFAGDLDYDSITKDNIYVFTSAGKQVTGLNYSLKEKNEVSITNNNGYRAGETYYLFVEDTIKEMNGEALEQPVSIKFTIKD